MSQKQVQQQNAIWEATRPFLFGGIAGCTATSVIQPIDTVQVRIQIINQQLSDQYKAEGTPQRKPDVGFIQITKDILKADGIKGFYKGLDSALMRQVFYGTSRLGLFKTFSDYIKNQKQGKNLSLFQKSYCSLSAGFLAAIIGNPADLILVRMQADTLLPVAERRGYSSFMNAMVRIPKQEGFISLWRGCNPTIARAMSANLGMLATFDEVKEKVDVWRGQKDLYSTQIIASFCAAITCAVFSLPFDNIKTKLQSMKAAPDGSYPYRGVMDCFLKSSASQGFFGLWVGLNTYVFRVFPHVVITLLTLDGLNAWYKKNYES